MADTPAQSVRLALNYARKVIKAGAIRLSNANDATETAYVDLIVGAGAPSGGYGRDAAATLLYLRNNATTVATGMYISVDGGTTWTAMNPAALTSLDLNGTELILDADADTSITADTDDQIDVRISGADDFRFVANVFRALSGSTIETNTINETTAASGVTIDGLLIKDTGIVATPGVSTAAAGTVQADAGALPAGTSLVYPTTGADNAKGVVINVADKVTGRMIFVGNGVSDKILKVYGPTGATINGGAANAAFSTASGKGAILVCLDSGANTWLAW
jgi:hypothetical protein